MIENRGHLDSSEFSSRVIDIITAARRFSEQRTERGQNIHRRTGKKLSIKDLVKDNIRNLVMKEQGSSLYRLTREMARWKTEQLESNE